jgi:hypothetical protein
MFTFMLLKSRLVLYFIYTFLLLSGEEGVAVGREVGGEEKRRSPATSGHTPLPLPLPLPLLPPGLLPPLPLPHQLLLHL